MTQAAIAETAPPGLAEHDENGHLWIGAATVALTLAEAKRADLRGSIRVKEQTRIDVLETYCKGCRRPFEDVAGQRCAAQTDPELFHGGPLGTRAKRTGHGLPGHDCAKLGCNTGAGLAARRQEASRRNGGATDVRRPRPVPVPAPPPPVPAAVPLATVTFLSPDDEARHAARVLAARRGQRRYRNPLALTLW